MRDRSIASWFKSGSPWVWLNAAAVSASLIMVVGLLVLIGIRGMGHFWPANIHMLQYQQPNGEAVRLIGEIQDSETVLRTQVEASGVSVPGDELEIERLLLKQGNRDLTGLDFRWLVLPFITSDTTPPQLMAVERHEWGNFYGQLISVREDGQVIAEGEAAWQALQDRLQRIIGINEKIKHVERDEIGDINYAMERLRLKQRRYELDDDFTEDVKTELAQERAVLEKEYQQLQQTLVTLYADARRDSFIAEVMDGRQVEVPLAKVVRAYQPNAMSVLDKLGFYFVKVGEFITEDPREANTEGGIFPAIFGTVMMVVIMSVMVTPLGVVAAVYLREYAHQGALTRLIRIAVNNLAGVPSIVYGVFGLGFFVYFLGGSIDELFFAEALPAPTFGTGGLFWASLTLALLTLPVVIVATEEGLTRIPRSIREGSLALGATKWETLWRTVLPMASPAMMTGLILAVARAAGEVAPLMLVGVVKLAPSLPLDGNAPFLHLDRKFMHLGFHIYDVGFQSPNVEAARPLVYATALLLVLVILVLNLAAIAIRNRLRERYKAFDQ